MEKLIKIYWKCLESTLKVQQVNNPSKKFQAIYNLKSQLSNQMNSFIQFHKQQIKSLN